jgi:hypothetical protein
MCNHRTIIFKDNGDKVCKHCCAVLPPLDPYGLISGAPIVITSAHTGMSAQDKLKYWGIKDARTGEGITRNTDVREPIGITKKNKGIK